MAYTYDMTAEQVLEMIEDAFADARKRKRKISDEKLRREVAEEILLEIESRGLKAQVRRRLGI